MPRYQLLCVPVLSRWKKSSRAYRSSRDLQRQLSTRNTPSWRIHLLGQQEQAIAIDAQQQAGGEDSGAADGHPDGRRLHLVEHVDERTRVNK